jgi:hypothetical protein
VRGPVAQREQHLQIELRHRSMRVKARPHYEESL